MTFVQRLMPSRFNDYIISNRKMLWFLGINADSNVCKTIVITTITTILFFHHFNIFFYSPNFFSNDEAKMYKIWSSAQGRSQDLDSVGGGGWVGCL